MRLLLAFVAVGLLAVPSFTVAQETQTIHLRSVQFYIPAVGQTADGSIFGIASTLNVTMQSPGTGRVFLDVEPLTEIDMQGSARLAVSTAAAITGLDAGHSDFFFAVRTNSSDIGGPSAGGAMAVAVTALLEQWQVRDDVVMTGMINPDGSIGPIGGVPEKLDAVASVHATRFLVPLGQSVATVCDRTNAAGQCTAAHTVDVKKEAKDKYNIQVDEVADLYDAVGPFTGMRLVRPTPTSDPLKDAAYKSITNQLGNNITGEAANQTTTVTARYNAVRSSIAGSSDRATIEQQLATARARVESARQAQNDSQQYLASSFGFQALVALEYADSLISFFEQNAADLNDYTTHYLDATDQQLTQVGDTIRVTYPIPAARLDSQAAAEQRLLEAQDAQRQARSAAQGGSFGSALQGSSFARQRGESARWWHDIGVDIGKAASGPTVQQAQVEALIQRYSDTAQLEIQYGSYIVDGQPAYVQAQQDQTNAQSAYDHGQAAAALLDLVQVLAHTSTALVAVGGDSPVRQRLADLRAGAAYQIELAQGQGAPPVYALSLLELGGSQESSAPSDAYSSYSLARLTARSGLVAAGVAAPAPRIERLPATVPLLGSNVSWQTLGAVLGFLVVVVVALLVLALLWAGSNRRQPHATPAPEPVAPPPPPPPVPRAAPPPTPILLPPFPEAPRSKPARPRVAAAPRRRTSTAPPRPRKPGAKKGSA